MITIRQLLDYYKEELTFHQVMELFKKGRIALHGGTVSDLDLTTLCESYDLECMGSFTMDIERLLGRQNQDERTIKEFEIYTRELEAEIHGIEERLQRSRGRKSDRKEQETALFGKYIELSEAYETIFFCKVYDKSFIERAIRARKSAEEMSDDVHKRNDLRLRGDNLYHLGRIELIVGRSDDALTHLRQSRQYLEEVLESIGSFKSRSRAQENGVVGVLYLFDHSITGDQSCLDQSVQILST
jgi:predicted nuclease with TOPRIM domain